MNVVSHHGATMRFLYGYVVRKNISPPGGRVSFQSWEVGGLFNPVILKLDYFENI